MTRYRFDIECDDLGEYDAKVVEQVSEACWRAMGGAGMWAYRLTVSRKRDDEPEPREPRALGSYNRTTPDMLSAVAQMVRDGQTLTGIGTAFGVSYRQASRYVAQARAEGLVP